MSTAGTSHSAPSPSTATNRGAAMRALSTNCRLRASLSATSGSSSSQRKFTCRRNASFISEPPASRTSTACIADEVPPPRGRTRITSDPGPTDISTHRLARGVGGRKYLPGQLTFRLLAAVPMALDLQPGLAGRGVGQHCINRPGLLIAIKGECHLVAAAGLPDVGRVRAVNLDCDARIRVSARATEVLDLEHDTPWLAARIHCSIEDVDPGFAVVCPSTGALAALIADFGHDR